MIDSTADQAPHAALMPQEHLSITIGEMSVGESRRAPRFALKLDDEGHCFLLTDRIVYPNGHNDGGGSLLVTRAEDGFHVTIPAYEVWHPGSLGDVVAENEPEERTVPVVSIEVAPPEIPTLPQELALSQVEPFTYHGTYIRIGLETTIDASEVATYRPYRPDSDLNDFYNTTTGDDLSVVRSLITTGRGMTYASTLTPRELDNRLRKAGHTIL